MAQQISSVGFTYEVFLSFRGFDTRFNFTGNLYKALEDKGIHTFMDDRELQGGEEITPSLLKAIENSRIAIIVFSVNYADSFFCLDELVKIIDFFKVNDRLILPVFYGVEPTHLRHHTGSYGIALAEHGKKHQNNIERLQKWKNALNQAANLSGHTFNPTGKEYEFEFIGKIVDLVSNKINRTPLHVADLRVGLESRVLKVKSLLNMGFDDGVCMLGIHGIGGIGKTTLAKEIYNSIGNQFETSCFLDDVREKTHQHRGLVHLQETLLHEMIKDKNIKFGSVSQGIPIIKKRLHTKKVLLILDDIDDLKQLEALVGGCDWFGPGSVVIVTTRDLQLLKSHGIEKTYEVGELNEDEALKLLMWKAFKYNNVDPSYEDILKRVVTYASGLPLALEVVGSNLCGKHIEEWDSTLARYKKGPHKEIQKILKVSFDTLDDDEQNVFLDIACCLRGYDLSEIEDILHAHYGDCMKYHIRVLVEKSLVKISQHPYRGIKCVTLHDLIVDMGKNIVLQESSNEPGKRRMLWLHTNIVRVLEDNTGTDKIEIIRLDFVSTGVVVDWNGKTFKKMRNLKTLIINIHYGVKSPFSIPKLFPTSLRVLEWTGYPFEHIPSIFLSKKFENMTILKIEFSEYLIDIPDVSGVPNLEIFSFRFCFNLITIHKSVGFLSKLKILVVEGCSQLINFPPIIKLPSLQELRLSRTGLRSFPEISGDMKNITQLALEDTFIEVFPSSFQKLTGLCNLKILQSKFGDRLPLPISILMMLNLSRVVISGCRLLPLENDNPGSISPSKIKVLHLKECELSDEILQVVLKLVPNVEELDLSRSNFTIIPECIKECRFLRRLTLINCRWFKEMRGVPPNLKYLTAWGCNLLTSFSHGSMLLNQKLHEDGGTMFCFSGRMERIPKWFEHQSKGTSISFWFRKRVPAVALFFQIIKMNSHFFSFGASMRINGKRHPLRLLKWGPEGELEGDVDLKFGTYGNRFTYVADMRLQDMGLESELDEALLRNEWIHAELVFCNAKEGHVVEPVEIFIGSGKHLFVIESGIHVIKQKTSMEDIQFTNPYQRKRKLDERVSCSLPHFLEEGCVKVNCAVAFPRESDVAACGGILRDNLGSILGGFAGQIGDVQILHGELKAILYGVQFAWNKGYRKVIVESESRSVIQLLRNEKFPPDLSCLNLVREIQIFASSAGHVDWSHTSYKENVTASALAMFGLKLYWEDGLFIF